MSMSPEHEQFIDDHGLDAFILARSFNSLKDFQDTDEIDARIERIRLRDRAFMLEELGGDDEPGDGPRLKTIKEKMVPGSPENFLHAIEYLGMAAVMHRSWDLSQRVMEIPGWQEQIAQAAEMHRERNAAEEASVGLVD